jgi:hypothetical protein
MNPYSEGIALRAVGEVLPISIATAIAIETACGISKDNLVNRASVLDVDEVWINIRTLHRNFMGSLDTDTLKGVPPVFIAPVLVQEMDLIDQVIREYSKGGAKAVFYFSNYKDLKQKYPRATVRKDNTDKQKSARATMNDTMAMLFQMVPERIKGYDLKVGDTDSHKVKALMLTHIAFDLLSFRTFKDLSLIESHTGALKQRAQWYTKYANGKELAMIPFREDLIQVFGDSELFQPMDIKLRKELIDVATKNRWGPLTTKDKITHNLKEMPNQFAAEIVRSVLIGP